MVVEIYSKAGCHFCQKAKAFFETHGIPYQDYDVSSPEAFRKMQERIAGANAVPQILIDDTLVGGWEVFSLFQDSILAKLQGRTEK